MSAQLLWSPAPAQGWAGRRPALLPSEAAISGCWHATRTDWKRRRPKSGRKADAPVR